jgi:hypothetical protein
VGKQTLLGVIAVSALAAIAWKAEAKDALLIAIVAAGVVALIAILNFYYSHKHPVEATLEGAEMLALQHQVLAAKSLEPPKDSQIIPNPGGAEPKENPPTEPDK